VIPTSALASPSFGRASVGASNDLRFMAQASKAVSWASLFSLSSDLLMHVKCIHELCSLLDHIPSYLIVLWGLGLVCHWFRVFLNKPLSFRFNTAKQISLVLHVFDF
jgi:hypothetical protein